MKTGILTAFALATVGCIVLSQDARAQGIDPQCPPGTTNALGDPDNTKIAQDACQKAIDLFKYLAPQLGAVLAGGSPTQGISGTLGGPGHFSFGIRANGLHGSLPKVDLVVPKTSGAVS